MGSLKCSLVILVTLSFSIGHGESACKNISSEVINPTWKSCEALNDTNTACKCPGCEQIQTNLVCNDTRWTHINDKDKEECLNCQKSKCWSGFQPWKVKCPKDTKNAEETEGASKECRCYESCDIIEIKCNASMWEYNNSKCNDAKIELPPNLELKKKNEDFIFTCHPNYQLMGKNTSKCENGTLNEEIPSCLPVTPGIGNADDNANTYSSSTDNSDIPTPLPAEIPGVDNETEPPKMPDIITGKEKSNKKHFQILNDTTEHPNSEGPPPSTKESGTDENMEGGDENMEEGDENMEGGDENMEGGDENMEEGDENMEGGDGDIPTTIPEQYTHTTPNTNTMEPSSSSGQNNQSAEAGNIYVVIFLAILLLVIVITVACMLLKRRKQQYDMEKCDVEMAKRNSCVSNEPEGGQIKFDNDELVEEDEDAEDPLITNELTKETPEERKSIIGVLEINVPGEADELLKTILIPVNGPSPDIAVGEIGEMNVADNEENNSNNTENEQVPKDKETEVDEKVTNVKTSPIQTTEETEKVETAEKTEQIPPPENSEQVQTAEKTEQIPLPENPEQVQTAEKTEQIPLLENSEQVQTAEKTEQIPLPANSEQVQTAEITEQVKNPRLEPLSSVTSNELLAHNDFEVTTKPVEEMPTFEEEPGQQNTGNSTPEGEQRSSIAPDEVNDEPAQIETTVD